MARCDVCGNESDRTFTIAQSDRTLTFDSFECAIHAMAPECAHCHCRIIGHGVDAGGAVFCCTHCAQHASAGAGTSGAPNRSWQPGRIGQGGEGLSKGYGGSQGPGTGASGPEDGPAKR